MFLFISHACFKQTGLSATLLLLSLAVHAAPSEVAEKSSSDADVPLHARSPQDQMPDGNAQNYRLPHWPHHMQASKTIIPPPPPGPYKSSALNDYSVSAPVPVHRSARQQPLRRQAVRNDSASVPMDMFSPDVPWPTNLRPEQPMPEHRVFNNGQHYARPQAMPVPPYEPAPYNQAMKQRYGNYNYGKRQGGYPDAPYMNDMGMPASRWMPSMSMAPPGPYNSRWYNNRWNYAPNFSPDYRSNYESQRYDARYARPVINNSGSNPVNPAYR